MTKDCKQLVLLHKQNVVEFTSIFSGYCYERSWLELAALFLTSEEIIVSNYAVFTCSIEKKTFLASEVKWDYTVFMLFLNCYIDLLIFLNFLFK